MRILLYTGKGGVGKTSMSAASALRCAELGYRTVVLSTDPAHSLGDSFEMRIGSELTELGPNLWGQEIDLLSQMDQYWGRVQGYMKLHAPNPAAATPSQTPPISRPSRNSAGATSSPATAVAVFNVR